MRNQILGVSNDVCCVGGPHVYRITDRGGGCERGWPWHHLPVEVMSESYVRE